MNAYCYRCISGYASAKFTPNYIRHGGQLKAHGGRRQHWCQWESFHWSIVYTVGATQSSVGR